LTDNGCADWKQGLSIVTCSSVMVKIAMRQLSVCAGMVCCTSQVQAAGHISKPFWSLLVMRTLHAALPVGV